MAGLFGIFGQFFMVIAMSRCKGGRGVAALTAYTGVVGRRRWQDDWRTSQEGEFKHFCATDAQSEKTVVCKTIGDL